MWVVGLILGVAKQYYTETQNKNDFGNNKITRV